MGPWSDAVRLVVTNDSFRIHGVSYPGFPLIYGDGMQLLREPHLYLVYRCIRNGRAHSPKSWERYGRDLYDYFGFVLANDHDWTAVAPIGLPGVIEAYRDWAVGECELDAGTVNQRLRTISDFYKFAHRHGFIGSVPFDSIKVVAKRAPGFLAHASAGNRVEINHLMLRHPRKKVKFLLLEECRQCIRSLLDPTHRLLFRLSLQTGLRNEELRTFPEKYVVDPMTNSQWKGKAARRLRLSHRDMKLKNDKDRDIDVTASMMADLWHYSVHERPARAALRKRDTPILFLTTQGTTVSASTLQSMFDALSSRAGFHVHPHMLRHTFATYTLYELHKRKYKGDPLMYVADRLGHSSLYTTQVYLHLLRDIEAGLIELYESELDKLFQEA